MITDELVVLVESALRAAGAAGEVSAPNVPRIEFERPRRREHGDWATNIALNLAQSGGNPRAIAEAIVSHLPDSALVESVDVAGPGFLNFKLSDSWLHDVVRRAANATSEFGRSNIGQDEKINVEYVSANPTGPVTVVLGRHAAVGDTISRLLEATGYQVVREYYFNDAGKQVVLFAESVAVRYLEHHGIAGEIPEEGYQGEYVREIAENIAAEVGDELVTLPPPERVERIRQLVAPRIIDSIRTSLERFGTKFDVWFMEANLHASGEVEAAIQTLREKGLIQEREGATWFLSSQFGDDKDRVVIKSDGNPTYFAADLGYLLDKERRGFEHMIYVWGADHHGTIPRLLAAADALGIGRERIEIPLIQIVTLLRGGETLKASKRAGVLLPLDELLDEVGVDAARYTFLTRSIDAPLDFDIELVKEQAPENPVYYVQYAHARICSIVDKATGEGHTPAPDSAPLERLGEPAEDELMRKLASFEEVIVDAAAQRSPQKITRFVEELASDFSAFYRDCRVVSEDKDLTAARLALCIAARRVIADCLALVGVSAPEEM
jgi:arginyl-tRNA synthetase